jgi:hypothetical protein
MPLSDDIFPTQRDPRHVQTEWSEGWFGAEAGFGYAAEYLTDHRGDFGATIDQAGIAVFFLQRHRVELALKGLLDAVGEKPPEGHSLRHVWGICQRVLKPKDAGAWATFAADHKELMELMDGVDALSFTFRYPVDKTGAASQDLHSLTSGCSPSTSTAWHRAPAATLTTSSKVNRVEAVVHSIQTRPHLPHATQVIRPALAEPGGRVEPSVQGSPRAAAVLA